MNDTANKKGLNGIFDGTLASRPGATAIALTDGRGVPFAQLNSAVGLFAQALCSSGVAPGDVVALVMPHSLEFVIALLAITSIRATAAPLNPAYTEQEFAFFLEDQGAVALLDLAGDAANATARLAAHGLNLPVWETASHESAIELSLEGSSALRNPIAPTPVEPEDDVALLVHTSGSTSRPKGVPLTHANLLASIRNIADTYEFGGDDCSVLVMPLFHVHGLMAGLPAPLPAPQCLSVSAILLRGQPADDGHVENSAEARRGTLPRRAVSTTDADSGSTTVIRTWSAPWCRARRLKDRPRC